MLTSLQRVENAELVQKAQAILQTQKVKCSTQRRDDLKNAQTSRCKVQNFRRRHWLLQSQKSPKSDRFKFLKSLRMDTSSSNRQHREHIGILWILALQYGDCWGFLGHKFWSARKLFTDNWHQWSYNSFRLEHFISRRRTALNSDPYWPKHICKFVNALKEKAV